MSLEQTIQELKKKITDPDNSILRYSDIDSGRYPRDPYGKRVPPPWWLKREWMRKDYEVYPRDTEVLTYLNNQYPQFAIHISLEEPDKVAYTPDASAGEQDKQVRLYLTRLLAKLYPFMSSSKLGEIAADHAAELSTDIEILTGEAITEVYRSGAVGACMSKKDGAYGFGNPTIIYDAPNIGMAVDRDKEGNIIGRAMLYTPSEDDKRFIRVYASERLKKKLIRLGYKPGTWHGAKFKTVIPAPGRVICPYLDGNGGAGGVAVSAVALINGELTSISADLYNRLRAKNQNWAAVPGTEGYVNLEPFTDGKVICPVSGLEYSQMTEDEVPVWLNGQKVMALARTEILREWPIGRNYNGRDMHMHPDTPTFTHRGYRYIDSPDNRKALGYIRLSPTYYPEEQDWVLSGYSNRYFDIAYDEGDSPEYIKKEDCIGIVDEAGDNNIRRMHKNSLQKGWIKLHARHKGEMLYATNPAEVVKTDTGRKVHPLVHEIRLCIDGKWRFARSCNTKYMGSGATAVFYAKGTTIDWGSVEIEKLIREKLLVDPSSERLYLSSAVESVIGSVYVSGNSYCVSSWNTFPWEDIWSVPKVKAHAFGQAIQRVREAVRAEAAAAMAAEPLTEVSEQAAFDAWMAEVQPAGDAEHVQHQWAQSAARAEWWEREEERLRRLPQTEAQAPEAAPAPLTGCLGGSWGLVQRLDQVLEGLGAPTAEALVGIVGAEVQEAAPAPAAIPELAPEPLAIPEPAPAAVAAETDPWPESHALPC